MYASCCTGPRCPCLACSVDYIVATAKEGEVGRAKAKELREALVREVVECSTFLYFLAVVLSLLHLLYWSTFGPWRCYALLASAQCSYA